MNALTYWEVAEPRPLGERREVGREGVWEGGRVGEWEGGWESGRKVRREGEGEGGGGMEKGRVGGEGGRRDRRWESVGETVGGLCDNGERRE